ncbi:hypothetical protein [Agrobacterium vitis]|uniref:hypothetical protein n=1 Tax=Agrobacterium vitis TaxID=373 RepID=UPI0012E8DB4E|nr:hypothetical protein [Agrobacterium vitis]MVA61067.1 hypothetical protein [Agrobacterium vitis]
MADDPGLVRISDINGNGIFTEQGLLKPDIQLPLSIKGIKNIGIISLFQFLLSLFIIFTLLFLIFTIIKYGSGKHNVADYLEIVLFILSIYISMDFVSMTLSNLWVDAFEGGVNITIDESGIFDSRISHDKILFSQMTVARIISRPVAGTGGVLIRIPSNFKIRNFHITSNLVKKHIFRNKNVIFQTKYMEIPDYLCAKAILLIVEKK